MSNLQTDNLKQAWKKVDEANRQLAHLLTWFEPHPKPLTGKKVPSISFDCLKFLKDHQTPSALMKTVLSFVDFKNPRIEINNPQIESDSILTIAATLSRMFKASVEFAHAGKKLVDTDHTLSTPQSHDNIIKEAVSRVEAKGGDSDMAANVFGALVDEHTKWNRQFLDDQTGPFQDFAPGK